MYKKLCICTYYLDVAVCYLDVTKNSWIIMGNILYEKAMLWVGSVKGEGNTQYEWMKKRHCFAAYSCRKHDKNWNATLSINKTSITLDIPQAEYLLSTTQNPWCHLVCNQLVLTTNSSTLGGVAQSVNINKPLVIGENQIGLQSSQTDLPETLLSLFSMNTIFIFMKCTLLLSEET